MADADDIGMDKAQLKKLLSLSKKEPVSCAVGMNGSQAAILLDKIKQPKAVSKLLVDQFPNLKNPRWGSAWVDVAENPKLVILTLNKAASGLARSLKKSLKGTGYSQVEIRLEDGSVAEKTGDEDEAGAPDGVQPRAPGHEDGRDAASAPDGEARTERQSDDARQPAAGDDAPSVPADNGELTRRLTEAVRRVVAAVTNDPSRKAELTTLATQAQAALRAGDPATAASAIAQLEAALAGGARPAAGASAFAKARVAWIATRKKVENDIDKLQGAFTAAFKDHPVGPDLGTAFKARADKVLDALDETLAHKLDEVTRATDAAQHARLVQEARQIIQRYETTIASDPTIKALDENPFVPVSIQKTMTATLSTLSKLII